MLLVFGAIAMASVDFGDGRINGDFTAITFLGAAEHAGRATLTTGARIGMTEYFWFKKPGYGVQANIMATYRYFSFFPPAGTDMSGKKIDTSISDPVQETHLVQLEAMAIFRIRELGLGVVLGPEFLAQSKFYTPAYQFAVGPVMSFQFAEPTKNSNLQFIVSWRPKPSLGDLDVMLKYDVGALSVGAYFNMMLRERRDVSTTALAERLIPSGGIQLGTRIPW